MYNRKYPRPRDVLKVQVPTCVNNLKNIGVSFRLWSWNHNNQFPFNVSTNEGGARELSLSDGEGYISNSATTFKALARDSDAEFTTTLLLICPKDVSRRPAVSFSELQPENITYRLRSGTNLSADVKQVLLVCPIDGNTLYTDGSVSGEMDDPHAMRVK